MPDWLAGVIDESWQQVYGARIDDLHLPESQARRQALMVRYGADGYYLLEQVHGPGAPAWLRELPAVRRCAGSGSSSSTGRSPMAGRRCGGGRSSPKGTVSRRAETG